MTAVEFIVEQLAKNGVLHSSDIAKAKEMEKEQKIEFACQVSESSSMKYIQGKTTRMIAEELLTA